MVAPTAEQALVFRYRSLIVLAERCEIAALGRDGDAARDLLAEAFAARCRALEIEREAA